MRLGKNEAIYNYLAINHPELVEDDFFKPDLQAVVSVPQKSPEGAIYRTESALDLLERTKKFNVETRNNIYNLILIIIKDDLNYLQNLFSIEKIYKSNLKYLLSKLKN